MEVTSSSITIEGIFEEHTCYTMTVAKVTDKYGQVLENLSNSQFFGVSSFERFLNPLGVVRRFSPSFPALPCPA